MKTLKSIALALVVVLTTASVTAQNKKVTMRAHLIFDPIFQANLFLFC